MAPLVVGNHVIAGVSGDFDNLVGYLRSFDPETGETQWQWNSTPPAGTPNTTTGGMTWMTAPMTRNSTWFIGALEIQLLS